MIETRPFGRTEHASTAAIFGAFALAKASQADADRALDLLLEYGVNHIDTAASYGDSEVRMGPWMSRHRQQFFLATKTAERTYQAARDEFHRSLERLQVDHVDLLQLHCLIDSQEWEVAMGPGGALEAAVEARDQGLVRFIGVTGHGTAAAAMHMRSLEAFDFDSVLLPYSFVMMQNTQYAADVEALLTLCLEQNVAVQTIKSMVRRPWGDRPQTHENWYEPFLEQADIDRTVHWVLSRPGIFLNTVGNIDLLPLVLNAASRFQAGPSDEEMHEAMARLEAEPFYV
jgi:aryl-alcohol dehydrogenase-like predicted oxidoreductase